MHINKSCPQLKNCYPAKVYNIKTCLYEAGLKVMITNTHIISNTCVTLLGFLVCQLDNIAIKCEIVLASYIYKLKIHKKFQSFIE